MDGEELLKAIQVIAKRTAKSGYNSFAVLNGMIIACYDVSEDSDIGMHYVFHIPDELSEGFSDRFIWVPSDFTDSLNKLREEVRDIRLKRKLPPRAVVETATISKKDLSVDITISVCLHEMVPNPNPKRKSLVRGEPIATKEAVVQCPIYTPESCPPFVDNMLDTFQKIVNRVEKTSLIIDLLENGLVEQIKTFPRVFYFTLEMDGKKIRVPMLKSFLRGINKFESLSVSVIETNLPGIFMDVITITSEGYTDQYISYIQNFK